MLMFPLNALPLGFRFKPTDKEIVDYFLHRKINGYVEEVQVILQVDLCRWEPSQLPGLSPLKTKDMEWFFFCPCDQKYPNGLRSNRSTKNGFWKSTGRDRQIKDGTAVIGMKKTLVFYEGRAPKGRKTDWKIHEYRTTLPELDGTHPGQGAYVVCRLFKDDDENIEGSHIDEGDPAVSSPTTPKSSLEVAQSALAQVTPVSGMHAENQPTNSASCQDEDFDGTTPDTLALTECQSNSSNANDADDQVAELIASLMDPQLEEFTDMDLLNCLILEPEDQLLSPFPSQMKAEVGSSDMHCPVTNDFSNDYNGLQLQYGSDEHASIDGFLDSVINYSDESCYEEPGNQENLAFESETPNNVTPISQNYVSVVKDSRSCSELDPEVAQAQLNPELVGYGRAQAGNISLHLETTPGHFRTLNFNNNDDQDRRTSRFARNRSPGQDALSAGSSGTQNSFNQGTARRRLRLQRRLEVGSLLSCEMRKLSFRAEDDEEKSTVTKEGKAAEKHTTGAAYATTVDEPQKIVLPESNQEVITKLQKSILLVLLMLLPWQNSPP